MANPKIVDYIKQQLNAGYSQEAIKQALLQAGWFEEEIDEAFYEVQKQQGAQGSPAPASQPAQQPQTQQTGNRIITVAGKTPQTQQTTEPENPFLSMQFLLPVAGGALIILNAVLVMMSVGDIISLFVTNVDISILSSMGIGISATDVPALGMVLGAGMVVAAVLMVKKPQKTMVLSILVLALSVISILAGNGFIIGGAIGAIQGVVGIIRK